MSLKKWHPLTRISIAFDISKMPQLGSSLNSWSYQHARLNDQTHFSCLSQPTNKFVVQHCSAFGCLRYKGQNVKVIGCCSGSIAALSQVFLRIGPPLHSGPKDKIVVGLLLTWESSGTLEPVGHTRLLRLGVANSVQNTLPQICVWGISYKHWTFTSLRSLQWFWPTSASRMQFWPCMSKLQYVAQERTWPTWQLGPVWWWGDAFRSTGSCESMWRHKHRSANENTLFFVLTQKDCWHVHMICTLLITWTLTNALCVFHVFSLKWLLFLERVPQCSTSSKTLNGSRSRTLNGKMGVLLHVWEVFHMIWTLLIA